MIKETDIPRIYRTGKTKPAKNVAELIELLKVLPPELKICHGFGRLLFIYALHGHLKCYSANEIRPIEKGLLTEGWVHTATIDPARWIEAMANNGGEPSDMLDELQFLPNAKSPDAGEKGKANE